MKEKNLPSERQIINGVCMCVCVCVFMRVANENMKQDESGKEKTSQKVYMEIPVLNRVVQGLP